MDAFVPAENNFALSPYKTVNVSIKWPNPAVNRMSRKRAPRLPCSLGPNIRRTCPQLKRLNDS